MNVWLHAWGLHGLCMFWAQEPLIGILKWRWICFSFGWLEISRSRSALTEIRGWQQNLEELNSKAQECWNGSIASEDDLNIGCFCFLLQLVSTEAWEPCVFLHTAEVSLANFTSFFSPSWQLLSRMTESVWQQLHCTPVELVIYTFNLRTSFFLTRCKLWHDSLMYSTHQQHNMGIDRLDSCGDDVLILYAFSSISRVCIGMSVVDCGLYSFHWPKSWGCDVWRLSGVKDAEENMLRNRILVWILPLIFPLWL